MQIEISLFVFFFFNTPNSSFIHFRLDPHVEHFVTTASTDTHAAVSRDWENWIIGRQWGGERVCSATLLTIEGAPYMYNRINDLEYRKRQSKVQ